MSEPIDLINISSLTELAQDSSKTLIPIAKPVNGDLLQGFYLHISDNANDWVVSTYLSDKPKHYKRSDALLKEAKKIGLPPVLFEH